MISVDTEAQPRKLLGLELREIVRGDTRLDQLLLSCARAAISAPYLEADQKKEAAAFARHWLDYVDEHGVCDSDVYAIRGHVTNFAKSEVAHEAESITLREVDVASVQYGGSSYTELISPYAPIEFLNDPDIAIYGGTARTALKMLAGVDPQSELPVHDVDAIIPSYVDTAGKARYYGVDLTGAKVIDKDISEALPGILAHADCTMNQCAIYNGKLLFSSAALEDIKTGVIRILPKDDPLFGKEGFSQEGGLTYLDKKGFYRGLSFLFRGKGKKFAVSLENIEQEKDSIERYWLIMLLVKLAPMKNEQARYEAIGHWHDVAYRMGCTKTDTPVEFYKELITLYPETRVTNQSEGVPDMDSQVRWIIEKLADRAVDLVCGPKEFVVPSTCTPSAIELAESFKDYDIEELFRLISGSRFNGKN